MRALQEIFKKHQSETQRLKAATSEKRIRAINTSKHKIKLLKSKALGLEPSALHIRELIGLCQSVEDYLLITLLFYKTGNRQNMGIVYETLLQKLDRTVDLIKVGKQMISFGLSEGFDFITKANKVSKNVYERILVQETFNYSNSLSYGNVA